MDAFDRGLAESLRLGSFVLRQAYWWESPPHRMHTRRTDNFSKDS